MAKWTFSVSAKLKQEMDRYPEINWSSVVIEGIRKHIASLEEEEKCQSKDKFH
jgi:hypothetical protein